MPTVEEIEDESHRRHVNEKVGDDDDEWDDESDLSDYSSDDEVAERGLARVGDETFFDRLSALRDIVPPSTRNAIAQRFSKASRYGTTAMVWGGRIAWVVTTSALLVALPCALAAEEEARIVQAERDTLSQQQGAQQVSF